MGKNISDYAPDTIVTGDERLIGTNDNGETANFSIRDVAAYAQAEGTGRMALYDGATVGDDYEKIFGNEPAADFPARLEFTGALNDETFFPDKYGTIVKNINSAPASSSLDFRFLPLGLFIEFDVEFTVKFADDSGNRLDKGIVLFYEMTFPNGTIQTRQFMVPHDYIVATNAHTHNVKFSFSTYMKTLLTDALVGGNMRFYTMDAFGATEILTIKDLTIRVKV